MSADGGVSVRRAECLGDRAAGFLLRHPDRSLWQAPEWEAFMRATGNACHWIVAERGDAVAGVCLVCEKPRRFGFGYAYLGRGPLADDSETLACMLAYLGGQNYQFVLVDPPGLVRDDTAFFGLKRVRRGIHPPDTIVIDLGKDVERLYRDLSEITRRQVRKADSAGAVFSSIPKGDERGFADFMGLMGYTASRHGLPLFEASYYRAMLDTLDAELFVVDVDGQPRSAALVVYFGGEALFYYGASSCERDGLSTSYFLQWNIMLKAKERGCVSYDLCGVAPVGARPHYLAGVTAFKERFGGERRLYESACVLINRPLRFMLTALVKKGLRAL